MLSIGFDVCYCLFFLLHRTSIDSSPPDSQPANKRTQANRANSAEQNVVENADAAVTAQNGNGRDASQILRALNSSGALNSYGYAPNENMQQYSSYRYQDPYYNPSYSSYDYCG